MTPTPEHPLLIAPSSLPFLGRREVPAAMVVSGKPDADAWGGDLASASTNVRYGHWVGQVGTVTFHSYPADEFFTLLEGRVALRSADGHELEIGPGTTVLLRKGWRGTWSTLQVARKTFVILETPAGGG